MKRKSPLSITSVKLATFKLNEEGKPSCAVEKLYYKRYRDFAVDDSFSNISIKLDIFNKQEDRGVRRDVKLCVIDLSTRYEVASKSIKVNIGKDKISREFFVTFPHLAGGLTGVHSYILMIFDESCSELLSMTVFHLHDCKNLGHPTEWFSLISGGIMPGWEEVTYKVLKVRNDQDYFIRFVLYPTFKTPPTFLPELKVRLYSPERMLYLEDIQLPEFDGIDYYEYDSLTVDFPLVIPEDRTYSTFYAELLCMEHPIAGFVFDTNMEDQIGEWDDDDEIAPLDVYTPSAAAERLNRLLGYESETTEETDLEKEFEKILLNFATSKPNDDEDEAEDPEDPEIPEDPEAPENPENPEDPEDPEAPEIPEDPEDQKPLLSSLDHLTGLREVKEKLTTYENVVRFNKMRLDCGLPISPAPLHAMFLGSPGTGKTTVAKLMGEMLHRAGILSSGHVVVRERSTLIGKWYSSEAEKTLEALEEAQGGILFIDEAYQLNQPDDPRDPGRFVIETLLSALSDESNRDWMLILAGYPDKMRQMFDINPGFKSRIPDSNIYTFDDFSELELMEIAENYLSRQQYSMTPEARSALTRRLEADYKARDKSFGNARHVINLIQTEILPSMAVRVISEGINDNASLTEIQLSDIPAHVSKPSTSRHRVGFSLS